MQQDKLNFGSEIMGRISLPLYYIVSFTVTLLDVLIFSYLLKRYLPIRKKGLSRWDRIARKIAGFFGIWGTIRDSLHHTIIAMRRRTLIATSLTAAKVRYGYANGIGSCGISMFSTPRKEP